MNTTLPKRN